MGKVYDKLEIIEKLNSKEVIGFLNKYNITTMIMFVKISILNTGKVIYSKDNSKSLEVLYDETDRIYRENENSIYFRKLDVLS